jgi:hypothetical protein
MKLYFEKVFAALNPNGIFIQDSFGGMSCYFPHEERKKFRNFEYFWQQNTYNPLTNEAIFHVHFKIKGKKKTRQVFTYDWRIWSVRELREIMKEVGFQNSYVNWEGILRGEDSNFPDETKSHDTWTFYIIGSK